MKSALSVTYSLACLTAFNLVAQAEDWSRFRGPNGAGVSDAKTIPTEIGDAINWSIKIKGEGHSSPVIRGDKIFLTSVVADKEMRYVLCYNTKGKKQWEHSAKFSPHSLHRFNSFASSTPAVDDKNVYISWTTGDRHEALALTHDGNVVWEKQLGYFEEKHGSSSSPVVVGDTLLVSNDHAGDGGGYLMGLNTATGDEKWKVKRDSVKASFSTPTIYQPENGDSLALFSSNPIALTALNPKTGEVVWEYEGDFRADIRTVASPVICNGIAFASAGNGGSGKACVAAKLNGSAKPEMAWEMTKSLPYVPTPVAYGKHFFLLGDNGVMSCVDATTGDVAWKERVTSESYSSPLCIDGKIYCFSRRGEMAVIAAKETYEKLADHDFEAPVHATPAVSGDRLYVRTDERLLSIGKSGGE